MESRRAYPPSSFSRRLELETTPTGSTMTYQDLDVNCCLLANLAGIPFRCPCPPCCLIHFRAVKRRLSCHPSCRLIDFRDYDRCGVLRVLQACSILVVVMSVVAVVAFLLQRLYPDECPHAGYCGRLIFAFSSLFSVLSIILVADLRDTLAKAMAASPTFSSANGSLVYSWGYYIWIVAMILKIVAVVLVATELYAYIYPDETEEEVETEMEIGAEDAAPEAITVGVSDKGPDRGCCVPAVGIEVDDFDKAAPVENGNGQALSPKTLPATDEDEAGLTENGNGQAENEGAKV